MNDEDNQPDARWDEPDARAFWIAAGVASPNEAESWLRFGFVFRDAQEWKRAGFDDPFEACLWRDAVFTPAAAVMWSRGGNFGGFEPDEAGEWFKVCVYDPVGADLWLSHSIEPEIASCWLLVGCSAPQAVGWTALQVHPLSVQTWKKFGISDPQNAEVWMQDLGDQSTAFSWLDLDFDVSTAIEWRDGGFAPAEARGWLDLGVETAKKAAEYKAKGNTVDNPPQLGRRAAIAASRKKQHEQEGSGK